MDSDDSLDILDIHGNEFIFLDYPNSFLTGIVENDLNKSANTQLDENFKELIESTIELKNQNRYLNGKDELKTNYMDELNDLKELKKIEDKKSYQQSLNRMSKLNLGNSNGDLNGLTSNNGLNGNGLYSNGLNSKLNRFTTYKAESRQLRTFRPNNHSPSPDNEEQTARGVTSALRNHDVTFDIRNVEENDRTFLINDKKLFNSSSSEIIIKYEDDDDAQDNTFVVAKNYDEVQEIARKQEECLKKSKTMQFVPSTSPISSSNINNATIVKVKKNGSNKLDNTITLKYLINENLNDAVKSPNLDGTFNLGNPMENFNFNSPMNGNTIKKEKLKTPNRNSLILSPKSATGVKKPLNGNLESKNNRLNASFIVSDGSSIDDKNIKNAFELPNQFSTITKNKINKNLKRTNTFKVREFQYASEENLTSKLAFTKNNHLNPALVRSGLSVNNYQSIDDMKNYETMKLNQRKVNKMTSKSNSNITSSKTNYNIESNENLNSAFIYKNDGSKLSAFSSRLKAPSSRISVLKSEEI